MFFLRQWLFFVTFIFISVICVIKVLLSTSLLFFFFIWLKKMFTKRYLFLSLHQNFFASPHLYFVSDLFFFVTDVYFCHQSFENASLMFYMQYRGSNLRYIKFSFMLLRFSSCITVQFYSTLTKFYLRHRSFHLSLVVWASLRLFIRITKCVNIPVCVTNFSILAAFDTFSEVIDLLTLPIAFFFLYSMIYSPAVIFGWAADIFICITDN